MNCLELGVAKALSEAETEAKVEALWRALRTAATEAAGREPKLGALLDSAVLARASFETAFAAVVSEKLASRDVPSAVLRTCFATAVGEEPSLAAAAVADLQAVLDRDPASRGLHEPLLFGKGFHALQAHRVAHWHWVKGERLLAQHLQSRCSEVFGVDIHPAAQLGRGLFIDHATSVVMGETSVVEDDVSLLHEVTLGGTGKQTGDRHPKVRRGVLICAGAKVLGNVEVGEGAKIGAGSVVLEDVPPHCTVAGVPAVVVGRPRVEQPSLEMDQRISND
jgi:serine O-acetyltransferase